MKGMPPRAVWLFEDETILRLLPELRRAWALRGQQARIGITGENAKCVLFGALNPRTGHRIVARGPSLRQEHFQGFLRLLRRSYPGRPIWLILDKASCHTTPGSQALARSLAWERGESRLLGHRVGPRGSIDESRSNGFLENSSIPQRPWAIASKNSQLAHQDWNLKSDRLLEEYVQRSAEPGFEKPSANVQGSLGDIH
jgi:hypothetical protein